MEKYKKHHIITRNLNYQIHIEEIFVWPDGSLSVSDIQDYFKYIIKKHEKVTDNLPIKYI